MAWFEIDGLVAVVGSFQIPDDMFDDDYPKSELIDDIKTNSLSEGRIIAGNIDSYIFENHNMKFLINLDAADPVITFPRDVTDPFVSLVFLPFTLVRDSKVVVEFRCTGAKKTFVKADCRQTIDPSGTWKQALLLPVIARAEARTDGSKFTYYLDPRLFDQAAFPRAAYD